MKKEMIKTTGMSCNHCIHSVEELFKTLPLESYKVELNNLEVEYDEAKISYDTLKEAIEEEGYTVVNEQLAESK